MECEKCADEIQGNDVYEFKGKSLCDDCYMDLVMGIECPDISSFHPQQQYRFRNMINNWNRNRPIYKQIKFK